MFCKSWGRVLKIVIYQFNDKFTEDPPICFPQELNQTTFPPAMGESSFSAGSSRLFLRFLICAILTGVKYLIIVLILIS